MEMLSATPADCTAVGAVCARPAAAAAALAEDPDAVVQCAL
jgi:hypothetical protein